jgi:DNA-binding NarL/FixJ family response regulator
MSNNQTTGIPPDRPVPFFFKDDAALLRPIPFPTDHQPSEIETALHERIKELNCLYGIFRLAERHQSSLDKFLQELTGFLPHAWQYADKAKARIVFRGQTYISDGFRTSKWRQSAQILVHGTNAGECAIFYTEGCPPADEGPFLREERILLDTVAEQIGILASRIAAEEELQEINRQLKMERQTLQETNTALRVVLSRNEAARHEVYRDISSNVEKVLKPILFSLGAQLQPPQKAYAQLLSTSLEDITSPFVADLARICDCLSPAEIAICSMIKNGFTTKQIADVRCVCPSTVNRHRENIRRKLKITNQKVNLITFLQANLQPAD